MKLRVQLLIAGAFTLLLPVMAYRAVQQMDQASLDTRKFELDERADMLRAVLHRGQSLQGLSGVRADSDARDLYAERVRQRVVLDGYDDDWVNNQMPEYLFTPGSYDSPRTTASSLSQVSLRLSATDRRLHIFLSVKDQQVAYHDPTLDLLSSGDQVNLYYKQPGDLDLRQATFRAIAPGPIAGHRYGPRVDGLRPVRRLAGYRGFWTSVPGGYQLELDVPLPVAGSFFGITVIDRNNVEQRYPSWLGSVDPQHAATLTGKLVYPSGPIERQMDSVLPDGSRARLFDAAGRMRADVNKLYLRPNNPALIDPARTHLFNALLYRFFEWVNSTSDSLEVEAYAFDSRLQLDISSAQKLDSEQPVAEVDDVRLYTTVDRDRVLGQLTPITIPQGEHGYLLFETNEDMASAFTSSAMVRLFTRIALLSLLIAGLLFLYATWLSWRIRNLTAQARSAVAGDGRHQQRFLPSGTADEIGELSRTFAHLLQRSRDYTEYLEKLASRLSHELRTPLSVVRTSLENIDLNNQDQQSLQFIQRAHTGAEQLTLLVRSMSEATRLEQTVLNAHYDMFNAREWLENAVETYRVIYPGTCFALEYQARHKHISASPELLQQLLDKLVSNAVDFATSGTVIRVKTVGENSGFCLSVVNDGKQLSVQALEQLFEPMYSSRSDVDELPHLGLGLYIVRLIADAHSGDCWARNVSEHSVEIGVTLR